MSREDEIRLAQEEYGLREDEYCDNNDNFKNHSGHHKGLKKTFHGSNRQVTHQSYNPDKITKLKTLEKKILNLEQEKFIIEEHSRKVANMKRIVDETIKILFEQAGITYLGDLRRMVKNSSTEDELRTASDMLAVISRFNGSLEDHH